MEAPLRNPSWRASAQKPLKSRSPYSKKAVYSVLLELRYVLYIQSEYAIVLDTGGPIELS